jgi:hypothetical protein
MRYLITVLNHQADVIDVVYCGRDRLKARSAWERARRKYRRVHLASLRVVKSHKGEVVTITDTPL